MTRHGGRPNNDRVRVTVHISRSGKAEVERLATHAGVTASEMYRILLNAGVRAHASGDAAALSRGSV